MCLEVIKGNVDYSTVRQLASLVGGVKNIVTAYMYNKLDLDSCLCQVDIEKTLDKARLKYEYEVGLYYKIVN